MPLLLVMNPNTLAPNAKDHKDTKDLKDAKTSQLWGFGVLKVLSVLMVLCVSGKEKNTKAQRLKGQANFYRKSALPLHLCAFVFRMKLLGD